MILYVYSKDTKEYIGTVEANTDPLESAKAGHDIYVIPPYTTPFPPYDSEENKVNIFNKDKNMWELVEDYRGTHVFNSKGMHVISELGPIPDGYSLEPKYDFQADKSEKLEKVNVEFSKAQQEKVKIGDFIGNSDSRLEVTKLKEVTGDNEYGAYNDLENPVILSKQQMDYIIKYLYIRSLLLPIRRKEIINNIRKAKSKKQLEAVSFSFDVDKLVKNYINKESMEELNTYIEANMK